MGLCDLDIIDMCVGQGHCTSLVMDNKCVKYYRVKLGCDELWPGHGFSIYVYCELDLGDLTLGQCHGITLDHEQQLCEISSRSNMAVMSYDPDMDFGYVCNVTLTLKTWPWVKVMTHPLVMDNNCVKYHQAPSWQWGVLARTRILGMCVLWPWPWRYDLVKVMTHPLVMDNNCVKDGQVGTKLLPGHDLYRRTDRQGDSFINYPLPHPPPQKKKKNFVCGVIMMFCSEGRYINTRFRSLFDPQTKEIRWYQIAWYNLPLFGVITFQHSINVLISGCTTKTDFGVKNELNWLVNSFSPSNQIARHRISCYSEAVYQLKLISFMSSSVRKVYR